ncbi:MAG: hypothetical protein AAB229_04875 [Candidatus Hydrogenedentota bacterium]
MAILLMAAPAAHAHLGADSVARGESHVAYVRTAGADSSLIPGGVARFHFNTAAVFGARGTTPNSDTIISLDLTVRRLDSSVAISNIIDTIELYLEGDGGQLHSAADSHVASVSVPAISFNDTARYNFSALSRVLGTGTETFLVVIRTRNDLNLHDTRIVFSIVQLASLGVGIESGPGLVEYYPVGDSLQWPVFQFRVSADSTGRVIQGNRFLLQDSGAPGQSPFTAFQGILQGETRTVGGDSLSRFGVHFGGTAGSRVDSAWLLLGPGNTRVDLARTTGNHWSAGNITTVSLALAGGSDTFRVVASADTPPLQSFMACTVPVDSVGTKFRRGNVTVIDSSGIITFIRPRASFSDSPLAALIVHADSRSSGAPYTLARGTLLEDTLLTPILAGDTVLRFGLRLQFGAGMTYLDVESVGVTINGVIHTADSIAASASAPDSYMTGTINQPFGSSTTYSILITLRETAPVSGTVRALIPIDSVTFRHRAAGPSDSVLGSRLMSIARPRVMTADSPLGDIVIYPDSRSIGSDIPALTGRILPDTLLTTPLPNDTITRFALRLNFGNGMDSLALASGGVKVVLAGETFTASPSGNDTWFVAPAKYIADSAAYSVHLTFLPTAPANGTCTAQLLHDSISTFFRVAGPPVTVDTGRRISINRPRIIILDSALANIAIHPDTRVNGGAVSLLEGTLLADTLLSQPLPFDTITSFVVRLNFGNGMDSSLIASGGVRVVLAGETFTASASGNDTWFVAPNKFIGDSATYRLVLTTLPNSPVNGTCSASLLPDSISTLFRSTGPAVSVDTGRTIRIARPRVAITDSVLPALFVHPDTRVLDSFLVAAGRIEADTLLAPSLTNDTLTYFAVRLTFSTGISATSLIDSGLRIHLADSIYVPSRVGDTLFIVPDRFFADSITYAVYLQLNRNAPQGETIGAIVAIDSIRTSFRDSGPSAGIDTARVTVFKQDIILQMNALANGSGHPDTRVSRASTADSFTVDSFLLASGSARADTVSGIGGDTLERFGIRLTLSGINASDVDSVAIVINTETFRAVNSPAGSDSWFIAPNVVVTDTWTFRVHATFRESATVGATVVVAIPAESIVTTFRDSGPFSVAGSGNTFTCSRPLLGLAARLLAVPGEDTIDPIVAFTTPVRVFDGIFRVDSSLIEPDYDTLQAIQIRFGGSARDSVYNASFQFKVGGPRIFFTNIDPNPADNAMGDTWIITGLDSTVRSGDSLSIIVNLADTCTIGTDLASFITIAGCTAAWSAPGPGQGLDSSGLYKISTVPISLGMWNLGDTSIPPWEIFGSNPTLVCSGIIYARVGPVITPVYDTLTHFGVSFDTIGAGMTADSIVSVRLYLMPSVVRPGGDTISLDSYLDNPRSWRFRTGTSDTLVAREQPFQVFATFRDTTLNAQNLRGIAGRGDFVFARIPRDSVNSTITSGLAGETHSARSVHFVFTDTTTITQNRNYADTTFNPDSRYSDVPFVLFAGRINGVNAKVIRASDSAAQQWQPGVGDSLIYFAIRIFSANAGEFAADSVSAVTVMLSDSGRPIILTRGASAPAVPLGDNIWHWSASIDSRLLGPDNSDTFLVFATVMDTIPSGSRLRAEMFSDSVRTLYQADSIPRNTILGSRTVTLNKPAFAMTVVTLSDTTVAPFRAQNDSTVAMQGRFTSTQIPIDTILTFGVRMTGLGSTVGESYSLRMRFEPGATQPGRETTLVLLDTGSTSPTYRLSAPIVVDSAQAFTIRMVLNDSPIRYAGDSLSFIIPTDSVTALFAQGAAGNLSCSRIIRINYLDTVVITDQPLADTTIHPDSRARMNPFIAFTGTIRGQTSASALSDTLQRIGFRFTGTTIAPSGDSIVAAWVQIETSGLGISDSISLFPDGVGRWMSNVTKTLLPSAAVPCTLVVQIAENVTLGSTLRAVIDADSFHTFFTNRPDSSVTASRTVTFGKPSFSIASSSLADTTVTPFRIQNDSTTALQGKFTSTYAPSDSLAVLRVKLVGSAGIRGESLTVRLFLDSAALIPAGEVILALADTSIATSPVFALGAAVTIDTGQNFSVRVATTDSPLRYIGQSFTALIETASSSLLTGQAGNISCSRVIRYNFIDTVTVTDSALTDTTIHPDSRARMNPYIAFIGTVRGQASASAIPDTLQRIGFRFTGSAITSAGDSIVAAWVQVESAGLASSDSISLFPNGIGRWFANLTETIPSTSAVRCTLHVQIAENVALGTTMRAVIDADSFHTTLANRPDSSVTASRLVTFGKTSFTIAAATLSDTTVSPFREQNDSTIALQGKFAATFEPSDSLANFQVKLVGSAGIRGESLTVRLFLDAGSFTPASETTMILLTPGTSNPIYSIQASATVDSGQSFTVRVATTDSPLIYIGQSITAIIDSASTAFLSGQLGNISCSRVIRFNHVDTVAVTDSALADTTIHPDSRARMNPFIAFIGTVRGQTSASALRDTLQRIGFRFTGSAITDSGDSIVAAWVQIETAGLAASDSISLFPNGIGRWFANVSETIPSSSGLRCTLVVQIAENVALGTTLRAVIDADSFHTALTNRPDSSVTASRAITFGKPFFAIAPATLPDTTVSPFRVQNDSTVALQGKFSSTFVPSDSLVVFRAKLFCSPGLTGEQLSTRLFLDAGSITPAREITLTLVTPSTSSPVFSLPASVTIDSGQSFTVRVATADSPLRFIGQSFTALIETVSSAFLTGSVGNISCSRVIRYNHVDTVLVSDSALANITVHPDSRLQQNPFIALVGTVRGQTSATAATDSLQRLAFRFTGDGASGGDSVRAAWVLVDRAGGGWDTFILVRQEASGWTTTRMDSPIIFGSVISCTLVAEVFDTVQLGAGIRVRIDPDSVHTFLTNRPDLPVTASRNITFGAPKSASFMDTLSSKSWVHPIFALRNNPNWLRSRSQDSNPTVIMSGLIGGDSAGIPVVTTLGDTLQIFTIVFTGAVIGHIDTVTLTLSPGESIIPLAKQLAAGGQETWGIANQSYGFTAEDPAGETFFVTIRIAETVPQAATLFAWIPAHGLKTLYRDTGPGAAATSSCTFTYRRDSMFIHTEPRNPSLTATIQRGDTKEIAWFIPRSDVEADTLHSLLIRILGSDTSRMFSFDTVTLYRDANRNRRFDSEAFDTSGNIVRDALVGYFRNDSMGLFADGWRLVRYLPDSAGTAMPTDTQLQSFNQGPGPLSPDTSEYLIVVRLVDTGLPTVRVVFPALGADGWYTESGPPADVYYDTYIVIVPDRIPPLPPDNFTVTTNPGLLVITFNPSPSGDTGMTGGQYNLFWDSGLGLYPNALLKTFAHVSGQLFYSLTLPDSTTSMNADSQYRFLIVSQDLAGNKSTASAIITAVFRGLTSASPAASVRFVTPQAGERIHYDTNLVVNRIPLVAQLVLGTASDIIQVKFKLRPQALSGFGYSTIGVAQDSSFDASGNVFYSFLWETSTLKADSYEIVAVAVTSQGEDTYATSVGITLQQPGFVGDTGTLTYLVLAGDERAAEDSVYQEQQVSTRSAADVVVIRSASGIFDAVLNLAQGSIPTDTARVTSRATRDTYTEEMLAAIRSAGCAIPRYWAHLALTGAGGNFLQGALSTITINYIDANQNGYDDSTGIDMSKARIYTLNAAGQLELLDNIVWNRTRRTLTGTIRHFSPFFISNDTGISDQGLTRLLVGPNPYIPNDANDENGRMWSPGDATSGILFKNLTPQTRIEIYTLFGEKIIEIKKNNANATVNWGAISSNGRPVASGVYLYVVTDDATGQRVTGKLAIIR